ncbi:hypothetical protein [Propioniciclava flava]|uniref:hypothetical protein n=1 Tax=Propioniciclava flava TaxID=2072026 RepID=UPI0019D5713A|nr:hypothetical protein [Propioniciclava flava]
MTVVTPWRSRPSCTSGSKTAPSVWEWASIREDEASGGVDDGGVAGVQALPHGDDDAVLDQDVGAHGAGGVRVDDVTAAEEDPGHAVAPSLSSCRRPASAVSGRMEAVAVAMAPTRQITAT